MTDLPGPAWELTKSFLLPPKVRFPDHVWECIKVFAVDPCPRCGGQCVWNIPCWRKDLKWLMDRGAPMLDPYVYRRKWYHRGGGLMLLA